ncbi:uncharacterized protein F4822DRAFT_180044 [Hypoxylon trugodes]|uniref:uncharacterized protein n=1 Tax=Hypoxylon trugodes TaxID=326681 RepID=UPI0021A17A65|nr:uncharacterized protein F4822DRAFT_180044 [Hypoxylon trugodes]KAI1391265.1 hypothetical protein F4822DRAFT_180044 [Hypoxylon trugodes]
MPYFNATSTAKFLSFATPLVLHPTPPPVTRTTLSPVTHSMYTTVYETVLPAACETSQWMATYTITETCSGKPADYVTPTIPPGFVVTTVACHACEPHEIEITCPGALPTGVGRPSFSITGNGVTATITAAPHVPHGSPHPVPHPIGPANVPVPVVPGGPGDKGGKPGSCSGPGPCPGLAPGAGSPPKGGAPGPSGSCSGSEPCHDSGSAPSGGHPGSGSGSGPTPKGGMPGPSSSCSGPGPCPGSGSPSGCSSGSCGPHHPGGNGTSIPPPAVVTAGAPAVRDTFALVSALAFVAGQFILL